ncbi:glycosyltransferase family 1 protein [Suillus clintonianus]|uniref:glycosyltransferase family 1 protein n=1 Tax=Suillus clintonianus TaxID=1904413 RepID=UPI001B86F877|nr:glycosyltransferase family 1 protein [Suillus clintonianus]KAG2155467.1 glycosyltransferase family 1 protein [Suillus clintonianus]
MSKSSPWNPLARNTAVANHQESENPHQDLRLLDQAEQDEDSSSSPQSRAKRLALRTKDFGKSIGGRAQSPSSPKSSGEHRRVFSLSRKGKGKEPSDQTEVAVAPSTRSQIPKQAPSNGNTDTEFQLSDAIQDDSPFIRPRSPSPLRSRPSLQAFRGTGSMRAGTQTLIQALQAIPWADVSDHDDDLTSATTPHGDEDSDEDSGAVRMASSIHAIYRPVARSRRTEASLSSRVALPSPEEGHEGSDGDLDVTGLSEEDADAEDFEAATPRPADTQKPALALQELPTAYRPGVVMRRRASSHAGSITTVKVGRRARLAEKLKEIFELDAIDEVLAELPCWLLRSVLLQGYMYLTNSHLCFFAHMPSREDQILKSGTLSKKANRTKRWTKHWFVLKNDALSWYQSSSDPYFINGIVDLRYAISCDPSGEKEIRLRTNQKNVLMSADSVPSREEWVKAIRKVIFKAQNSGDTVKIAIPYSAVIDVEKSSAIDFSETIEVKVEEEPYSVDSYFFAYFQDLPVALEHIRDAVRSSRSLVPRSPLALLDTTSTRPPQSSATQGMDRTKSLPTPDTRFGSSFRLSSLLRPFHDSLPTSLGRINSAPGAPEPTEAPDEYTHIFKRSGSSLVPITSSPDPISPPDSSRALHALSKASTIATPTDHTYPPSTSVSDLVSSPSTKSAPSSVPWNVGVPSWLKVPRSRISTSTSNVSALGASPSGGGIREVYSTPSTAESAAQQHLGSTQGDLGYSVLETTEAAVDPEATEKFRIAFAFDEKEILLGYFAGYLFRLLPLPGRLYVSTNYFCFKSTGPLTSKTRMILPIRDILSVEKAKGTRFGHYGLTVVIKGHEELFFEFGFDDRRRAFVGILERQMEEVRKRASAGDVPVLSKGKKDALILEEFEPASFTETDPTPPPESMSESLPAVMFTSSSSTFLTFKPKESLHFTFLTIGSRGDVQPYIALAKGLMDDGHRVKIATHGEFREWIEAYGIEFGYVGGDPAELMRICVENGTFTVAFLKEGLLKFRGWVDDLLKTSWEACQGTDVLIESPSAMSGYHIAEALKIPYFRAFTMTWTRTRAYPHAFAVPEHKMGGGYNYMTYVMFDQVFWRAISGQINRWRRNTLHIGNTSLDRMQPHKIPFLYNFSPALVPPPLDWPEWIRITGYWFLDDAEVGAKKWTPPPDLLPFIDSAHEAGKKVVYIGFGSIVVSDPVAMTHCVIEAVLRSGVYAILSKGWSDRLQTKSSEASEPEEPLPKQIYPINSIPHDWLFQRIDAACHHGGAGTTGASLRAGIPTIIKPFFGDQFFSADRVEALGIGTGVRKLTVESMTEALVSATTDIKQIERAKLVGEQIRAENGVATAIEAIYRDLDYARSLIKRTPNESEATHDVEGTARDEHNIVSSHSTLERSGSGSGSQTSTDSRRVSEDWSVISDGDDKRPSGSGRSSDCKLDRSSTFKRSSLAAAVMSVLPDALTPHRQSTSSQP